MKVPLTPSDNELLRLILAGDEEAFTTLYRRRQAGIYRFALQMCGSETIAEDVTQEVFIALIRDAHRFDQARGSLSAYLYGIARNQVLRRLEHDRPLVQIVEDADDGAGHAEHLMAESDPAGDLARVEMIERVRQAVLSLPAHYREAVVLCDLNEMSYAEASEILGCAVGTVRSRLHRARALLLEKFRVSDKDDKVPALARAARCFA